MIGFRVDGAYGDLRMRLLCGNEQPTPMMSGLITYYLEQKSPASPDEDRDSKGMVVRECAIKQYPFNRCLYQFVGEAWKWTDRLDWTDQQWSDYAENENLRTWVAWLNGAPAGYFELQKQEEGDVEVVLFGLASRFIGQGFGSYLLSQALESAWSWDAVRRVWLHTCTLDHPHALKNYTMQGLEVYHVETADT